MNIFGFHQLPQSGTLDSEKFLEDNIQSVHREIGGGKFPPILCVRTDNRQFALTNFDYPAVVYTREERQVALARCDALVHVREAFCIDGNMMAAHLNEEDVVDLSSYLNSHWMEVFGSVRAFLQEHVLRDDELLPMSTLNHLSTITAGAKEAVGKLIRIYSESSINERDYRRQVDLTIVGFLAALEFQERVCKLERFPLEEIRDVVCVTRRAYSKRFMMRIVGKYRSKKQEYTDDSGKVWFRL